MKFLYSVVLGSLLTGTAFAQQFEVPLTISDDVNTGDVTIGVHPNGTDGFDAGLDAFAPPPPPQGAFDVRSVFGVEAFLVDIRSHTAVEKVFHIEYQEESGQGPIVLMWDSGSLAGLGTFEIVDDITGALFGPLDMTTTNTLDVSSAGGLLDDGLRVLVTPSPPQGNSAPVARDDAATTGEDTPLDIDVLANDTDPDDDPLSVTQVADPPHGATSINADGTVRYSPDAGFTGADSFTYTAGDPGGLTAQATVTVTVSSTNVAPVFTSTPLTGATEGRPYAYTATAADGNGDPITLTAPTRPSWLSFSDQGDGTALLSGTPGSSAVGAQAVVLQASDGVATAQQAFTLTVSDQGNRAPTAQNDQGLTAEDTPLDIDVLANDTDPDDDALSIIETVDPLHGTVSINADGTMRYTPEADFNGNDRITYTAADPGGLTAQGTVVVLVTPVNDAPVFTSPPGDEAAYEERYTYAITATDVDGDALTMTAPTRPAWLAFTDNGDGTALLDGTPEQDDAGWHDVLLDVGDGLVTTTQAFVLTVTGVMGNLPPSATAPTMPADGATVRLEGDPDAVFSVAWNAASDPNDDAVHYRWELALTPSFSPLLFDEAVGAATQFETTTGTLAVALTAQGIDVGTTVTAFHRVVAFDGLNETVGPAFTLTLVRGVLVGVEAEAPPEQFALFGNYPNPFNPETVIRYALPEPARVHLAVYDAVGRQVAVLVDETQPAGYHERVFDASRLHSGTYFYQLKTKHFRQVKGMIFMK
jgi:VCBS repeat-containing protein